MAPVYRARLARPPASGAPSQYHAGRMTSRRRRIVLVSIVALVAVLAALVAFVWWGPVAVSNKRVLLDFMLGRGIEPPSTATVAEQPADRRRDSRVQVYSAEVPLARVMLFTPAGDLVVSRTRAGEVVLLERDRNGDGMADGQRVLFEDLDGPHGLALHDGWLYVAERSAVGRVRFDAAIGPARGQLRVHPHGPDQRRPAHDQDHRLRSRRLALPRAGLDLQRLHRKGPAPRDDHALAARRHWRRDLRHRPAQQRRFRLGALGPRAVRDRPRSRPAGRRLPALRTQPHRAGPILWLAVRERLRRAGS